MGDAVGSGRSLTSEEWTEFYARHDQYMVTEGEPGVTTWTSEELSRIGQVEELKIASMRRDGTMRPYVTI